MRKLKLSVKWFLVGLLVSQGTTQALKSYNNSLEAKYHALQLELEDYAVLHEITLETPRNEPCSTSSAKSYMDYRTITSKTSDQYQFIQANMTVRQGYLMDEQGYIGVALGSHFGEIGTRYVFTLDTGNQIFAVKVEEKDDSDTINGCEHKIDGSVIEFVIDTEEFEVSDNGYIANGNFNNIEYWKGNIVSIENK